MSAFASKIFQRITQKGVEDLVCGTLVTGAIAGSVAGLGYGCYNVPDENNNDIKSSMSIVTSCTLAGTFVGTAVVMMAPLVVIAVPSAMIGSIAHFVNKP